MRILITSDSYPPEVGSAAQLMAELAHELAERGHDITVLTNLPGYKLDAATDTSRFTESMMEGKVRVLRVKTLPLHNSGFIMRGFAQLASPYQYWKVLRRHEKRPFDAVIVYTPPLPLFRIGAWAKKQGARFLLNVQDLFPQNAIDLGVLNNPLAIALFRWIERDAYRSADVITAHSPMNRKMLIEQNSGIENKILVLHNWIEESQFTADTSTENFRESWSLQGKFVAVYGGVLGPAQGLDVILDVAERVRDLSDLVFLVVGDGMEKERLQGDVAARGLTNIIFKPFVARERYPALLHSADIGFLTLNPKMKTPVVPGKILGYMAMRLPVLAIVNRESDAHGIIEDAQCGYSCPSDDVAAAEALVRRLYAQRQVLEEIGERGRAYAKAHFDKKVIVDQVEKLLLC